MPRKIFTPIIHAAFLIPLLTIAMGSIERMAQSFGLLPNYIFVYKAPYIFLTISIIIISGTPLFWIANRLMQGLEKLHRPTVYDYFRQSIFFFFIIVYSLATWILSGFNGTVDDLYFVTLSIYSLISIVVNYIFLFRKLKSNVV